MSDCRKCADFEWCMEYEECGLFKPKIMTNADRIRAMTDEELSYYLDGLAGDGCPPQMSPVCNKERYKCNVRKCWLDWLKQEAET